MLVDSNEISLSNVKTEESMGKIFTSEMEDDDDVGKDILPENNSDEFYLNTNVSEQVDGTVHVKGDNQGKIFTMQSIVSEPSNGLQKSHNGNWLCDICGHEEVLKDDILTHRILHLSDDHSKQCPICEKKFSSSTSLRNHLTVHTGIKKFRCKYCGRKFGWKTQLAIHENLHTGKGLHHCQVCSKSFMTKWLLQRHLKIHLKEKRTDSHGNSWNTTTTTPKMAMPLGYDKFPENNTSTSVTPGIIEPLPTKLIKCQECNQTFKGDDVLAFHLLQHNSAKQNVKSNLGIKHQTSLDEPTERDISLENWSSSRCVNNDDNIHSVSNIDQEKLKLSNMKNQSKGSLTSIVSKLHNKVDEKQKSETDESTEVLILENSHENLNLNSGVNSMKDEYKLNDSLSKDISKQPMSTSSDPFISGISEIEHRRESAFMSVGTSSFTSKGKGVDSFSRLPVTNELTNSKQNEAFQRELRSFLMKQEKELSSLQSMVATLHGKVDSLTNIVTSQSLLINRLFLGGKMVVNGLLDFNIRPSNGGE